MDLEVVGRHALLFDDDSMAAFVNSGDALVEWNSLQIDRYDVRHLLSSPPPSRRRSQSSAASSSNLDDASIQFELDHERYLDLPPPSDEPEVEEGEESGDAGAYRAVGFSYGNTDDFADRKSSEAQEGSGFHPAFPVPESLLQCLPPTEKLHQIIARTALFVSKHGGQSEIVLRVKQGNNPTFGFLMPDHGLHAYFRFLVDHPELLQSDSDLNTQSEGKKTSNEHKEHDGVGGALSMLGSVYGFGEDEEPANGDDPGSRVSGAAVDALDTSNISRPLERAESSSKAFENGEKKKDEKVSTHSLRSSKDKEKAPAVKRNNLINASKSGSRSNMRKEDGFGSSAASEKTKTDISGLGAVSKTGPLVEPPSELKKLIDKIVEFILKNGKQFESTLVEQDSKHGRFPFLLPSNQYHPYYLKVLQKAQESKVQGSEKRSSLKESDSTSLRSVEYDLPYVFDKKEKFKMVIGKSKKETQDSLTRTSQQEVGVNVDAAAAAAILQAATRGIKNPNLSIISGSSKNGDSQGHSSEGAQASSFLNVPPFGPSIIGQRSDKRMEHSVSIPKVKEIAKSAAAEAASEADSSEAHLSKEQKLKAERLRRAKMFVALLKGGADPAKRDSLGGSVEPQESAFSGSVAEVNVATKEREGSAALAELTAVEREGSTAPLTNNVSNENEKSEMKPTAEEYERRSRRKYRSRSGIHEVEDEEGEEEEEEEEERSRKKRRSSRKDEEQEEEEEEEEERSRKKRRSSRKDEDQEEEEEEEHSRKKRRSSRKDEEEESEEVRDDKRSRKKRGSRRHRHKDGENAGGDEDDEDDRRSRKKHHRRHSSPEDDDEQRDAERHHKHGRKKHSSHRSSRENRKDDYEVDHKHSKKKHRSHRTANRSRDRHEHRTKDSSDDESDRSHRTSHQSKDRRKHRTKHSSDEEPELKHKRASSSYDEDQHYSRTDKNEKATKEREELEEGEILTKVSTDQSRGSLGGFVSREASVDVSSSSQQRAPSQPSESTEISDDLRAKIRAMLMATRT